jgi:hypothetical protein
MPLTGGATDKYGNRYEGRWTVRCFIEMMEGLATRIRLEPPGPLGEGAEFVLHRPPFREFHQVKRQYSKDTAWNLAALNQKVLPQFRERLLGTESDDSERCIFVSGHSAQPLSELAERAKAALTPREFVEHFDEGPHLKNLLKYWRDLTAGDAWAALRRIDVKIIDEELLKQWNAERAGVLVEGDPDTVNDVLAQLALDNVHQELDADNIRAHLELRGHSARDWAGAGGPASAIARSAAQFVAAADRRAIGGHTLIRSEVQTACMKLDAGARQLVIAGGKGSGKSGVVAQVVRDRLDQGWPVLVLNAGDYDEWMSPLDVGQEFAFDASPTSALAGVAAQGSALLVIDQLDEVALGGAASNFFNCIRLLVKAADIHERLAVVLACRSSDIEDDPRIQELVGQSGQNRVDVGLLDSAIVKTVVDGVGHKADDLTPGQLELLRLPLHLQYFVKASEEARVMSFLSPEDLIDCWDRLMEERYA